MAKGLAKHMGVGVINNEPTMPGRKSVGEKRLFVVDPQSR